MMGPEQRELRRIRLKEAKRDLKMIVREIKRNNAAMTSAVVSSRVNAKKLCTLGDEAKSLCNRYVAVTHQIEALEDDK